MPSPRVLHRLLVLAGLVALMPRAGVGQLLFDDTPYYEDSYARSGYFPYTADVWSQTKKPVYDDLGNFVMAGTTIWATEERRPVETPLYGSLLEKGNGYTAWMNQLVVAHDTYKTWSSRLIVGDRIRTKFTPLTLDLSALNGVRWDADLGKTSFTVVSSRYDWPILSSRILGGSGQTSVDNEFHRERERATYLLAGHLERQIGALNVGLSYANLNRTDGMLDWGDHSLKGVLPRAIISPPEYIAVRIADGSDRDGDGVRVYDFQVVGDLGPEVEIKITRHDTEIIDGRYPNGDQYFLPGLTIPPYVEFGRGALPTVDPRSQGYLEANGTQYLIYWVKIPEARRDQIESIRFRVLVANDYRIGLAEVYPSVLGIDNRRATYFYDVVAQEGNVRDQTNLRWVEFGYGRQSGRTTASVRADLQTSGLQVRSEFARTYDFRQYPSTEGIGKWSTHSSDAYFVNARKQLPGGALGGEYFHMAPRYQTSLFVQNTEYRSYSDLLGSPFPEVFPDWGKRYNYTLELNTVDDNDDKDLWPDFHYLDESFGDADGVFPGLDRDQNGRPDTNENGNAEPDYLEPFLLYKVDPPEYDAGDDLNNNGIVDHREDDRQPDYPYDVDSKGYNLFGEVDVTKNLKARLGRYRVGQIWGPGRNRVDYARLQYSRTLYPWAKIELSNNLRRVHDDIEDPTPRYAYFEQHGIPFDPTSVAESAYTVEVEDPLLMRNSLVNTAFADATLLRLERLRVQGQVKYDLNRQLAASYQPVNAIHEVAAVGRAHYEGRLQRLEVTPKVKVMAYSRRDGEGAVTRVSERYVFPMLLTRYPVTTSTALHAGAQGFPFLKATYRNLRNREVNYDSQDYILMISSRSTYEGYIMNLNVGYQLKRLRFEDRRRQAQDVDRTLFFLRLIMGVEPFQG